MALTAELDFIREDIRAAMKEHGKKASQYTGKRFEKMAGLLGHNPKRDKRDMEDGGDEDQGAAPKHHGLLGHNPTNRDEEEALDPNDPEGEYDETPKWGGVEGYFEQRTKELLSMLFESGMLEGNKAPLLYGALLRAYQMGLLHGHKGKK